MKRAEKNKPLWRKISPGTLYPFPNERGRRVKPKETIRASREEIEHVIDQFELIENVKGEFKVKKKFLADSEEENIPGAPAKDSYSVESAGGGWYNVLSPEGTVMNDKKLRAEAAEELKESLEEETIEE